MKAERLFDGLPLVGGHPALELMNTVEYRGYADPRDHLSSIEQLLTWCELSGLTDDHESDHLRGLAGSCPAASKRMLKEITQLREAGRKAMGAKLNGAIDSQALDLLRKRIQRAVQGVRVTVDRSKIAFRHDHPISGFGSLVDRIALSIEDAFAVATRESLRECEGAHCDWLFLDRSRARTRRWCHPGQCGNAERVRNFRFRQAAKEATCRWRRD